MVINKNKPAEWQGKYILKCKHCIGRNSKSYFMYCNIIREIKDSNKVFIEVFGDRYWHTNGKHHRYVNKEKITEYQKHFKD